jgi:hypothetical protein
VPLHRRIEGTFLCVGVYHRCVLLNAAAASLFVGRSFRKESAPRASQAID